MHPDAVAFGGAAKGVIEVRPAEVDLRRPRLPMEPYVPVFRGPAHGPPHLADLALRGRARSGVALFRHQPVIDPSRGVALLVAAVPARREHPLGVALKAAQQGRPPPHGPPAASGRSHQSPGTSRSSDKSAVSRLISDEEYPRAHKSPILSIWDMSRAIPFRPPATVAGTYGFQDGPLRSARTCPFAFR